MPADPIRVSWSALRAHETCKQKSHLIRQGKRGAGQNLRGYYHGMVVDSAMRQWLADPHRCAGDMAARIDALIDEGITEARQAGDGVVRWKSADDRAELHAFCVELVQRLEPILTGMVLPYEFQHGYRFKANLQAGIQPITLVGEMDLLVHNDGWQVWDLKGTKDNTYFRKVLGQLIFYDLATWCERGEKTVLTGLIQPMCEQQVMPYVVSDDDRRGMLGRILRMVADIKQDHHPCKDGTAGCSWCEVSHACPRYAPAGTTMSLGGALRTAAHEGTR